METKRLKELDSNEREEKKLREDLTYLRTNKLSLLKSGVYSPENLIAEENSLNNQIIKLQEMEAVSVATMHETIKEVLKLSELLKMTYLQYSFANYHEREEMIKLIFSELSIYEKELKYQCKNGFLPLQSRLIPLCDLTGWLSELQNYESPIKQSTNELSGYCNGHAH